MLALAWRFGSSDHTLASCVPPSRTPSLRGNMQKIVRQRAVVNLGLGQQDGQLAIHRSELIVAEERLRSETGAVHDDPLRQSLKFGNVVQLVNLDLAAGQDAQRLD
jgi:hypothetical protein